MTEINRFDNILIEEWVFSTKKRNPWFVKLGKCYYKTHDLLMLLAYWKALKKCYTKGVDFAKSNDISTNTVKNRLIKWKITYLKKGFYDKEKMIKYLTEKLN